MHSQSYLYDHKVNGNILYMVQSKVFNFGYQTHPGQWTDHYSSNPFWHNNTWYTRTYRGTDVLVGREEGGRRQGKEDEEEEELEEAVEKEERRKGLGG